MKETSENETTNKT